MLDSGFVVLRILCTQIGCAMTDATTRATSPWCTISTGSPTPFFSHAAVGLWESYSALSISVASSESNKSKKLEPESVALKFQGTCLGQYRPGFWDLRPSVEDVSCLLYDNNWSYADCLPCHDQRIPVIIMRCPIACGCLTICFQCVPLCFAMPICVARTVTCNVGHCGWAETRIQGVIATCG